MIQLIDDIMRENHVTLVLDTSRDRSNLFYMLNCFDFGNGCGSGGPQDVASRFGLSALGVPRWHSGLATNHRRDPERRRSSIGAGPGNTRRRNAQFWGTYRKIKAPVERRKFFAERFPQPGQYISRFLEIARSAPEDQAAVDSLIWIVKNGGCDPEVNRAAERLATNHASNKRLGMIAPRLVPNLVYSLSPSAEKLLRAIIAQNPDRVAQGQTCMALGEYLKRESELVRP